MLESSQVFLDQSEGMNIDQAIIFGQLRREPSHDCLFGESFLHHQNEMVDTYIHQNQENQQSSGSRTGQSKQRPIRKRKRSRKSSRRQKESQSWSQGIVQHIPEDKPKVPRRHYDKNICGYITKKVTREFLGLAYESQALQMTRKHGCDLRQCRQYYEEKLETVTGPSHMPQLFRPRLEDTAQELRFKKAFGSFFDWFLKERYLRHLIAEGKMLNKAAYLDYKNRYLVDYGVQEEEEGVQYENLLK